MAITLPVSPALDAEGRLAALVPLIGAESAKPVPRPAVVDKWDPNLAFTSERTTVYAKLGVSAVFSGDVSGETTTMLWNALVGKRAVLSHPGPSDVILETFWAVGLRTALTYRTGQLGTNVSVGILAAAAEFQSIDVQYEVNAIGLGPKELATVLRATPPLGRFDLTSFAVLNAAGKALIDALVKNLSVESLRPAMVSLSMNPIKSDLDEAAAYRFTMLQIAAGSSLAQASQALQQGAWKNVTVDALTRIYRSVVTTGDVPNDASQSAARAWLEVG